MDDDDRNKELKGGVVTTRTCECCGHHEIGMMTQDGKYIRLRPGMKITITEQE